MGEEKCCQHQPPARTGLDQTLAGRFCRPGCLHIALAYGQRCTRQAPGGGFCASFWGKKHKKNKKKKKQKKRRKDGLFFLTKNEKKGKKYYYRQKKIKENLNCLCTKLVTRTFAQLGTRCDVLDVWTRAGDRARDLGPPPESWGSRIISHLGF